jgi:hypothetical protein
MFWAFVAALSTGIIGLASGLILSRCGICCPPKERKQPENCNADKDNEKQTVLRQNPQGYPTENDSKYHSPVCGQYVIHPSAPQYSVAHTIQ